MDAGVDTSAHPADGGPHDGDKSETAAPEGCLTPNEPLKYPEKCLVDSFASYVSSTGDDTNTGTRAKPFRTVQHALSRPALRIVVCEGTYVESLEIRRDVALFSAVDCGFAKAGGRAKIVAVKSEFAVKIGKPANDVRVVDFDVEARDGTAVSANSVGILVDDVAYVRLTGTSVRAKVGFDGSPGASGATGVVSNLDAIGGTRNGYPATMDTTPGPAKVCLCTVGGLTAGGAGGAVAGDGQAGAPSLGATGMGGTGNVVCNPAGAGGDGAAGASGDPAETADTVGRIEGGTWKPSAGLSGADGKTGQGGGGGGGRNATNAGGGGGCGGCGGTGGKGGGGGGASIALLTVNSSVALERSSLVGGIGGTGGLGGTGGTPGPFGGIGMGTCSGGEGGAGGAGGAGGGGAGGIAYAIVYKGTKPSRTATTLTPGMAGKSGANGAGVPEHGPAGTAGEELLVP